MKLDSFLHGTAIAILAGCILTAAALGISGCKGPIGPQIVDVAGIVLADLEAGDSPSQISSDVCHALGGTATTDAVCADVTTIVADIITDLIAKGRLSPTGEARARLTLAAMHPVALPSETRQ